jgi:predicted DNA-binding transcriptional regulator AlpA
MTQQPDDAVGKLLTIKHCEELLGMSRTQIYRLAYDGQLELVKAGPRMTRVTERSVNKFVRSLGRLKQIRKV